MYFANAWTCESVTWSGAGAGAKSGTGDETVGVVVFDGGAFETKEGGLIPGFPPPMKLGALKLGMT